MRFPADKRVHILIAKRLFNGLRTALVLAAKAKGIAEHDGRELALPYPELTDVFRYISQVRCALSAWSTSSD